MKRKLGGTGSELSGPDGGYEQGGADEQAQSSSALELEQSAGPAEEMGVALAPHLAQMLGMQPGEMLSRGMFYGTPQACHISSLVVQLLDEQEALVHSKLGEGTSAVAQSSDDDGTLANNEATIKALMDSIGAPLFTVAPAAESAEDVDVTTHGMVSDLALELGMLPDEELFQDIFCDATQFDLAREDLLRSQALDVVDVAIQETGGDYSDISDYMEPDHELMQVLVEGLVEPKIIVEDIDAGVHGESSSAPVHSAAGSSEVVFSAEEEPAVMAILPATEVAVPATDLVVSSEIVMEESGSEGQATSERVEKEGPVKVSSMSVRILGDVVLDVDIIRTEEEEEEEEDREAMKREESERIRLEKELIREEKIKEQEMRKEKMKEKIRAETEERKRHRALMKAKEREEREAARERERVERRSGRIANSIKDGLAELEAEEAERRRKAREVLKRMEEEVVAHEKEKAAAIKAKEEEKAARAKAKEEEKAARAKAKEEEKAARVKAREEEKAAKARAMEMARDDKEIEETIEGVVQAAAAERQKE
ncbi:hypothetical protein [Candidatus Ichthyocystis sparus]|uniref:hypothetical protein n=1 Tax=Candidatus Ichthyocystis sparus TaxID=1561004 RepID=UPI000A937210|nr:hypothetical protein [Candidatus Ichthyocystis sparus]